MDKNKIQSLKDTVYLSMYKNHSCFRLRSRWLRTRVSRPLVAVGAAVLQLQEKTRKLLVTAMNRALINRKAPLITGGGQRSAVIATAVELQLHSCRCP